MTRRRAIEQIVDTSSDILNLISESKVNGSTGVEDFTSWLHTERGIITQLQVLFVLSVLLYAVQVVLGWWRRCSTNAYLKHSLWMAYIINTPLVIYILGLARSSPSSVASQLLQACAFPFVMALGSTNAMTAYSVDDNKQYMRHFIQQLLRVLSLFAMWRANETVLRSSSFLVPLLYLFLTALLLSVNGGRIFASMTASSFLDKQSRYVQLHMKSEHTNSTEYNPVTLHGYKYPFYEDDYDHQDTIITLDMVWCSNEGPLGTSDDGQHLKETCLSFSLFRLLRRRFFGLACPEAKSRKSRLLVLDGLLRAEENYEAAYRVIEAELAFAHDHFFTSCGSFNTKLGNVIILLSIAKLVIYPITILSSIKDFIHNKNKSSSSNLTGTVIGGGFDPVVTALVVMVVLMALEVLQLYLYLSSDWAKVKLARRSIYFFSKQIRQRWSIWSIFGADTCFGMFGLFIYLGLDRHCNKLPKILGYWQNKVGQHALLKDLHGRSYIADVMGSMSGCFFGRCLEFHPLFSRGVVRSGIKKPYHIQLTSEVKVAIARTLRAKRGHLPNGSSSLQRIKPSWIRWAFDKDYHTRTMLIWHVATEYCDIARSSGGDDDEEEEDGSAPNRSIATTLSCYCAYLMAFVPGLLPDEELDTRITFQEVRLEAQDMLSRDTTLHAKYARMKYYREQPSDRERTLIKGIRLGRKLQVMGDGMRWKVLADFWTEMILFVAPSHNAKAHIERLASGGEFLTHLWALLFHAGILERK
jgi:hypothetical protein